MKISIDELKLFHDSELVKIEINREKSFLNLVYLGVGGGELFMRAGGVIAFRSIDLGMQNVISRVLLAKDHGFNDADIDDKLNWISSCVDSGPYFSSETKKGYLDLIRKGEVFMIVLESSVGGESCLLCRELDFILG